MVGWKAALVAVVLGCGNTTRLELPPGTPEMTFEERDAATRALVAASATHDPSEIAKRFASTVTYGGMWFADTTCRRSLAVTGTISSENLPALAACLAPLTLVPSTRTHPYANVAVLTYEPGIEIEVMFDLDSSKITWLGFVGRRSEKDALPTVTESALLALRAEGAALTLAPETLQALDAEQEGLPEPHWFTAWLKVCVNAQGTVTGVHAHSASSLRAREAFVNMAKTWSFRPFVLGDQPSPVCAMTFVESPRDPAHGLEFPQPAPPTHADAVYVSTWNLGRRLEGETFSRPSDDEYVEFGRLREKRILAKLAFCLGPDGAVAWVLLTQPSGFRGFDARATRNVSRWRYKPLATPVCSETGIGYFHRR